MRAHVLAEDGTIINIIVVESLDDLPGVTLVDASIGGSIGDKIFDGVVVHFVPPPPTADEQRASIQLQIDDLEKSSLENRGSRELHLREMEREAAAQAAAISTPDVPVTADQVLATVPYYLKLKALDNEVKALRDAYNAVV